MNNILRTSRTAKLLIGWIVLCFPLVMAAQESAPRKEESLEDIIKRIPAPAPGFTAKHLPEQPWKYETGEGIDIEVKVIARGLDHPWGLVSLPDGTLLVSERNNGQLRIIRNEVLDPEPVTGLPEIKSGGYSGLNDIVLHPDFTKNRLIYLTYFKPLDDKGAAGMAVMRGTWDGRNLKNVEDIFVADKGVGGTSRLLFDQNGMLYASFYGSGDEVQDLGNLKGKVIRLTDNGKVPDDNPFVDKAGARPEIFTFGHRTPQGLVLHPETGEIWCMEMGPNGGDEINVLKPGANYGWPMVSLGRDYPGDWQGEFQKQGYEDPIVYWMPSISVSGMVFYSGDKLEKWKGDLLVGGLRTGEISGTGRVQRIRFNSRGQEIRRETLLADLRHRIRGVYQDINGYLYVLTDADDGAVLKIGPAN